MTVETSRLSSSSRIAVALLAVAWIVVFGPTLANLVGSSTTFADERGHVPILAALTAWLAWGNRQHVRFAATRASTATGVALLPVALVLFVVGRSQQLDTFEVLALPLCAVACLLIVCGAGGVRAMAFPLFLSLFIVPLPGAVIEMVTGPLKSAVSHVATLLLSAAGYPVARSGTILYAGPYQLLVADACAGLRSMFTLEALCLVYMHLRGAASTARNVTLALLAVPIAFIANTIRVVILVLVTLYFGDEAGQGFAHGFAGMVLFIVALMLVLATDSLLATVERSMRMLRRSRTEALA